MKTQAAFIDRLRLLHHQGETVWHEMAFRSDGEWYRLASYGLVLKITDEDLLAQLRESPADEMPADPYEERAADEMPADPYEERAADEMPADPYEERAADEMPADPYEERAAEEIESLADG